MEDLPAPAISNAVASEVSNVKGSYSALTFEYNSIYRKLRDNSEILRDNSRVLLDKSAIV
jgi:hypothetical protein